MQLTDKKAPYLDIQFIIFALCDSKISENFLKIKIPVKARGPQKWIFIWKQFKTCLLLREWNLAFHWRPSMQIKPKKCNVSRLRWDPVDFDEKACRGQILSPIRAQGYPPISLLDQCEGAAEGADEFVTSRPRVVLHAELQEGQLNRDLCSALDNFSY